MSNVEFERIEKARTKPWTRRCTCGCGKYGGRFKTLSGAKATLAPQSGEPPAPARSTMPSCRGY